MTQKLGANAGSEAKSAMDRIKAQLLKFESKLPAPIRQQLSSLSGRWRAASRRSQLLIAGVGTSLFLFLIFTGSDDEASGAITFAAVRGDLEITVLEGGALEATQSQELRSQIKGREGVKILSIVEEGYRVTPQDVESGLVLVELDTAALIDEQLNQEISVETAEASYIESRAQYEIQLNQNASDLNDARQAMRFARLDFEKFLGGKIVDQILDELEIDERLARAEEADRIAAQSPTVIERPRRVERAPQADAGFDIDSMPPQVQERLRAAMAENGGEIPPEMRERMQRFQGGGDRQRGQGSGQRAGQEARVDGANRESDANSPLLLAANTNSTELSSTTNLLMDEGYMVIRNQIDFSKFADLDLLEDGEAKQQLRSLQDELQVAQEELLLTQDRIAGQRRLEERGFITPTELEAEELSLNKANNKMQQKETELKLYIQYTFPKEAEQKLSDFENAVMSYQRQVKENVAEQAQEEARFSSAERKFNLEKVKLADVNQQIEFATIRAQRPGLVVYGAADQNSSRWRRSSQEAIQEGATVTERQAILTIPDLREMAVKVNIHESAVQRVAVGQRVRVSVDAFPDDPLTGTVSRVAVVADSANSFMNPDLKVYPTTINIDGTHEWLRPGMSAEVEILVDRLEDVVYVPVQAVTYYDDQRVVYVAGRGAPQRRPIEVGSFSDSFIEIVSGLEEGEQVLLLPPQQGQGNSQPDA